MRPVSPNELRRRLEVPLYWSLVTKQCTVVHDQLLSLTYEHPVLSQCLQFQATFQPFHSVSTSVFIIFNTKHLCTLLRKRNQFPIGSTIPMRNEGLCTNVTHSHRISCHLTKGSKYISQVQQFMYQNLSERYPTVFYINPTAKVCYDFIKMCFQVAF